MNFKQTNNNRSLRPSALRVEVLENRELLSATDVAPLADVSDVAVASVEVAPVVANNDVVDLSSISAATKINYNASDKAILEANGLTVSQATWNRKTGRLYTITVADKDITSLDLRGLDTLQTLKLVDQNIKTVNLEGLTALTKIFASNSALTSLDLSSQPDLNYLDVSGCKNLTTLDASGHKLTTITVKDCSNLTTLDVSDNAPGGGTTVVNAEGCSSLTSLDASNTPVSSVNLINASSLKSVDFSDSAKLSYLRAGRSLEEIRTNSKSKINVEFYYNESWTSLSVVDNAGAEISASSLTTASSFYLSPDNATNVTVNFYDANGELVSASKFNEPKIVTLSAPTATATSEEGSIVLTWDAQEGASQYVVLYKEVGTATYSKAVVAEPTFTIEATAGVKYQYNVKALGDGQYFLDSAWAGLARASAKATGVQLDVPTFTATTSSDSISLAWTEQTAAKYFTIQYKKVGDSAYTKVNATGSSYTLANLESGASYKINMIAVGDKVNSLTSAWTPLKTVNVVGELVALTAPTASAASTSNSITLAWDAQNGASAYKINFKKSTDSAYTKVTVTDTSYTFENLDADSKYKFNIMAVGDNTSASNSAWSKLNTVKTVAEASNLDEVFADYDLDLLD